MNPADPIPTDLPGAEARRALVAYLVASARTGDRAALGRLAALCGPGLLSRARRLSDDAEAARDLVQETWVEIIRALPRLQDDRAFAVWAHTILTRRAARGVRARMAGRRLQAAVQVEADLSPPVESMPADSAPLRRAIASLPEAQQAVLDLYYRDEMTVAEVARALDIPPGTVKTRLMHARARLRALLEGDQDAGH